MNEEINKFNKECEDEIQSQGKNDGLKRKSIEWLNEANNHKYSYHFKWMNRPIIQYPQDIHMMQELIMKVKPDLIIETGIAHGGSILFSASMLALLDLSESIENNKDYNFLNSKRKVLALDIDIREHNRQAIEAHAMSSRIWMVQGSAIDSEVVSKVAAVASSYERVMVILDSNHTHDHVLGELEAYAQLVTPGCYCVVFDTLVEDMPASIFTDRPWGPGNSPKSAVWEYLKEHPEFEIDKKMDAKLLISVAPDGYLRRLK